MFDDQPQNPTTPPANLPTEPPDMFESVEPPAVAPGSAPALPTNAISAGLLKKKESIPGASPLPMGDEVVLPIQYATKEPILGKILLILVILLVLGALGFIGWWAYRTYFAPPAPLTSVVGQVAPPAPEAPPTDVGEPVAPPPLTTATSGTGDTGATVKNKDILFGEQADSDSDGLPDAEEAKLGANPHNTDTDGDGLTDGDEVTVYGANPLKPDTDGDGLSDYDEVKIWHTNPLNPDTDGDGYSDGAEVEHGYNPLGAGKLFNVPTTTTATSTKK